MKNYICHNRGQNCFIFLFVFLKGVWRDYVALMCVLLLLGDTNTSNHRSMSLPIKKSLGHLTWQQKYLMLYHKDPMQWASPGRVSWQGTLGQPSHAASAAHLSGDQRVFGLGLAYILPPSSRPLNMQCNGDDDGHDVKGHLAYNYDIDLDSTGFSFDLWKWVIR